MAVLNRQNHMSCQKVKLEKKTENSDKRSLVREGLSQRYLILASGVKFLPINIHLSSYINHVRIAFGGAIKLNTNRDVESLLELGPDRCFQPIPHCHLDLVIFVEF